MLSVEARVSARGRLFLQQNTANYGNCYTFNTNVSETEDSAAGQRTTGLTGQDYSFSLQLHVKKYVYPPEMTPTAGARVLVHSPDMVPDVGSDAVALQPNTASALAIEQLVIQRLPSPYKASCVNSWEDADFFPVHDDANATNEKYSVSRCKSMCLQLLFVEYCDCFNPMYPLLHTFGRKDSIISTGGPTLPCDLSPKSNNSACTTRVLLKLDSAEVGCGCPPSCLERAYRVHSSSAGWPREVFLPSMLNSMNISLDNLVTPGYKEEFLSNVLRADIFFKTLNTQTIEQTPQYSTSTLLSSLGGALSLYLGISIVMVAEIFEFLFLLIWNIGRYCTGRYTSTVRPDESISLGDLSQLTIRRPDGSQVTFVGSLSGYPMLPKPIYTPQTPTPVQ